MIALYSVQWIGFFCLNYAVYRIILFTLYSVQDYSVNIIQCILWLSVHSTKYFMIAYTLYSVFYPAVYRFSALYTRFIPYILYNVFYNCLFIVQSISRLPIHCTVYFTLWCTGSVPYTQDSLPSSLLVWVSGVVETTAVLSSESEISDGVHRSLSWCWVLQSIKKTDNQVTDLITMSVCHVTYNQATDL